MAEFQSVAQVKKMRSGINLKAEVKSKGDPRTVNLKTGGTVDVCDAVISDGSDDIKLTLWGDDIKAVNIGDVVVITNGYTNEFKGEVSLTKGKFGKMEINPQ
jgi:replication factor A1